MLMLRSSWYDSTSHQLILCYPLLVHLLQGVNVCSDIVLQQPRLVSKAINSQLVVFTWGQLNNQYSNILAQRRMGVHAIIYDRYMRRG